MEKMNEFLESLRLNPIYDGFSGREDVFYQFAKADDTDIQIVYANYVCECYEGSASVIYYRTSTGKSYEVYGGHCSCYGLEDQWNGDEEIVVAELLNRVVELKALYKNWAQ